MVDWNREKKFDCMPWSANSRKTCTDDLESTYQEDSYNIWWSALTRRTSSACAGAYCLEVTFHVGTLCRSSFTSVLFLRERSSRQCTCKLSCSTFVLSVKLLCRYLLKTGGTCVPAQMDLICMCIQSEEILLDDRYLLWHAACDRQGRISSLYWEWACLIVDRSLLSCVALQIQLRWASVFMPCMANPSSTSITIMLCIVKPASMSIFDPPHSAVSTHLRSVDLMSKIWTVSTCITRRCFSLALLVFGVLVISLLYLCPGQTDFWWANRLWR